jgi:hypothetical protein
LAGRTGCQEKQNADFTDEARGEWFKVRMSDERAGFLSVFREESEERIERL